MISDQRFAELQERICSSGYPRRKDAKFTVANDHNPLILQDCPGCRGTGKRDRRIEGPDGYRESQLGVCSDCGGTGITGEVEPYFLRNEPEKTVIPDAKGWLRCPDCGIVFATYDRDRWTGYRHLKCGQRIRTSTGED